VKHGFNLFYCYLFRRHSVNDGNVIAVETLFQYGEVAGIFLLFSLSGGCAGEAVKRKRGRLVANRLMND
jgi:hypothetical protein